MLSENTHKSLTAIHELMSQGNNEKALTSLQTTLKKNTERKYDRAVIYQTMGYAYNSLGKYDEAIKAFVAATKDHALPRDILHNLDYIIAQLLIHTESFKDGLKYLGRWFKQEQVPDAASHMLAATAYYQLDNFKQMIPHTRMAIRKTSTPPQMWYELLLAGYFELEQYENAEKLLETMIEHFPQKDDYWLQLAGVCQRLNNDKKALAVTELAYSKGILKGDEILQLVKTYLYLQMPYKAGQILEKEIQSNHIPITRENLELLSNSWLLAQEWEKGAAALSSAAEMTGDSALYLHLGQIYADMENWNEADKALSIALKDNKLKDKANAYLLYGISNYHNKNEERSLKALTKAANYILTRDQAMWWLDFIRSNQAISTDS